jgi:hypothetical protein
VIVNYTGNGAYCFANSLAMALAAAGEPVEAWYIETTTAVGIGATTVPTPGGPLTFFSNLEPDRGLDLAIRTLGFVCERDYCPAEDDPDGQAALARLRDLVARGPVVVGPLDMSRLTYIPGHEYLTGADHFVLVHEVGEDEVFMHDPGGSPYVSLPIPEFLAAWRAESVGYRAGSYSSWAGLRRVARPSPGEVVAAVDAHLREHIPAMPLVWGEENQGPSAIRRLADLVREGVPPHLDGHLSHFALPLGARRSADFARFYAPYDATRAVIKDRQSRHFGAAFVAMRRRDWPRLAAELRAVADCDEEFAARTLAGAARATAR